MIAESVAMLLVISLVAVLYLRSRKNYALATIPLLILPIANIAANLLTAKIILIIPADFFTVYSAIIVIAAVLSGFVAGMSSNKFKKKSTRALYVSMSLIFNITLAAILVYNMFISIYGHRYA